LQEVSFELAAGECLGILGRTGSGKSSLSRLLLHLYDPQRGSIQLGGIPLQHITLMELPQRVGMVTQEVQLFQATLRQNLTCFNSHVPDQQILSTLEILGLMDWLAAQPVGLETPLAAESGGLSAGQAQLLAFARVFLKDPGLVILDEASSRLDPHTEKRIERALDRLLLGRTAIIIAHRLQTVERADKILILEQGCVVEYGSRQVLAQQKGSRYAHLLALSEHRVISGADPH
jgi:ABC-type multidrug transport system fused ATPase/permease subunit